MICKKLCSMTIWFWDQIVLSSFCCNKFSISMFPQTFHCFSENCIIINKKKKSFSKSFSVFFFFRSVFISIYVFSQELWYNFTTLWTVFKTDPWFNAYFKFLICTTYSVSSCKLAPSFSAFSIFILSGKNHKFLWCSSKFSRYWTSTSRKSPSCLSPL